MSQVAAKRKLHLRNERVKVIALFQEEGSVLGGTQRGSSERFSIEFSLDSDEPEHKIAELIHLAHGMCFTEHALSLRRFRSRAATASMESLCNLTPSVRDLNRSVA